MRTWTLIGCLLTLLALSPIWEVEAQGFSPWQEIVPGISYREFALADPNRVYVARMTRAQAQVIVESGLAQGRLNGGLETVRTQAERYDQAINYWGEVWGQRNRVVVAINGSYFDTQTGVPWSGQVHSAWYAKRFADREPGGGFVWTLDRRAFISGCVVNRPGKQLVHVLKTKESLPFDGLNEEGEGKEVLLFTPQYDRATPRLTSQKTVVEVVVQLEHPLTITPAPAMVKGVVRAVHEGNGETLIPFDHVVIAVHGAQREAWKKRVAVGDEIGFSQEVRHLTSDCRLPHAESWEGAYAGLAGGYPFLVDGVVQPLRELGAILRNPRTAVAFNENFVFFIVVDGRDPLRSVGMSMVELALFAKTRLNATWGVALDGGGSSTMVVQGEVKNRPNRRLAEQEGVAAGWIDRAVANSLMMVLVEPAEFAGVLQPGQGVTLGDPQVNVRAGPGTNYAVMGALPQGTPGVVMAHPLNGVLAKGYFWWLVDFGGLAGWVNQDSLVQVP